MKVDTLCAQALQHLKEVIELEENYPNDYTFGEEVRKYLNRVRDEAKEKDKRDKG